MSYREAKQRLPAEATVITMLRRRAELMPEAPYLTFVDGMAEPETVTFGEMYRRTVAHAEVLAEDFDVTRGDTVGLLASNNAQSTVKLLAILTCGARCLMLSPNDPAERLRMITAAHHTRLTLVGDDPEVSASDGSPQNSAVPPVGRAEDAILFSTSGSTAASKMVVQTHANAVANASAFSRHHGLRRGQRIMGFLPIHHANGVHTTLFAPLASGAHGILLRAFEPFGYHQSLNRYRPRIASAVPSVLDALLDVWRDERPPATLDYFLSAAAPLSGHTVREMYRRYRLRIVQGYGLSETTNFSTTLPIDLLDADYHAAMLDAEIPSVGVPLRDCEIGIFQGDTRVSPGVVGEVRMRGKSVFPRYDGNPEETALAFRGGWFCSGDLGYQFPTEGNSELHLVLTGRAKNVAKVRGEAVSLEEMERALLARPDIRDAVVLSVPSRLDGEELVAVIAADNDPGSDSALRKRLAGSFPRHAVPKRFIRLDHIPRTATGKVQRDELARRLALPPSKAPVQVEDAG